MIDYYCVLAKHDAIRRLSEATRRPFPGQYEADLEILRQSEVLRAITIHQYVSTAWAKLRNALARRGGTGRLVDRNAIG